MPSRSADDSQIQSELGEDLALHMGDGAEGRVVAVSADTETGEIFTGVTGQCVR